MKTVRNMPTSASDANNQGAAMPSVEDNIFDTIAGTDSAEDLFG